MGYLLDTATSLGISLWLLVVILIWSLFWKLLALWKSARKGHAVWFIVIAIFNTIGILDILYIYVFSDINYKNKTAKKKSVKKKSSRRKK